MKIREVIVVEGKNDTAVLKGYFDCDTIETHGSCLSEFTLNLIESMQKKRGVIIFTDPDYPGERIRTQINQRVRGCKNAFVPKEMAKTSKKVGVEHASKEVLEEALRKCVTFDEQDEKYGKGKLAPKTILPQIYTNSSDKILYGTNISPIIDLEYVHYISSVNLYYGANVYDVIVRWSKKPVDFMADNSKWDGYCSLKSPDMSTRSWAWKWRRMCGC
ncbi:MAG: ribonuclease M5 [Erysipelotrichaceae bacterium]|nr:ribonuclease M5 [Erysipelotrichaceae bacterium]